MTTLVTLILTLAMSTTTNQVWAVEYNGDIYTYVATAPDAEGAYIVTLDGETIYITDILGGENR